MVGLLVIARGHMLTDLFVPIDPDLKVTLSHISAPLYIIEELVLVMLAL